MRLLSRHLGRAPAITELARYCKKAVWPTWSAMLSLEAKGIVYRNKDRRFEVTR